MLFYLYKHSNNKECKKVSLNVSFFKNLEMTILKAIDFNLSRPTPLNYVRIYNTILESGHYVHSFTKLIIDLIIVNNKTCHFTPSVAAIMALILAYKLVSCHIFYEDGRPSSAYRMYAPPFSKISICPEHFHPNKSQKLPQVTDYNSLSMNLKRYTNFSRFPFCNNKTNSCQGKQYKLNWLEIITELSGYHLEQLQPGLLEIVIYLKKVVGISIRPINRVVKL